MTLYETLASDIETLVASGALREGDRVPSVRQASLHHRLSISTVLRAYALLESRGVIESRPQSGYFVRSRQSVHQQLSRFPAPGDGKPAEVDVADLVLQNLRSIQHDSAVPLGSPYPDPACFPHTRLTRHANAIARRQAGWSVINDLPPGQPELIRQIVRRYLRNGLAVSPAEVVVTAGATEAINLCLQAVARPGATIAVESPTFYASLLAIERMGMRAVEVPTDPVHGIDLGALGRAIDEQGVAACIVMPNFQNPLGFRMSDERKAALVALAATRAVPIIENAVYNELYYGASHPSSLKSLDRDGLVLHCASFSKDLTGGFRIGWALAGRYAARVGKLKFLNTLATPSLPQLAIADYLAHDNYDAHLRRMRRSLAQQARLMSAAVLRFFPPGTRVSEPEGGYVLWVALPDGVESMALHARALAEGITIGPGTMFSTQGSFSQHIRLNYSYPWTARVERAVMRLGRLVAELALAPITG